MSGSSVSDFVHLRESSLSFIVIIPALLLTVQLAYKLFQNLYVSELKSFPGPKLWAFTSMAYIWSRMSGTSHTKLLELHEKYGNVVRIAPNELSWIDEGVWKDVWAHRQGHQEFMKSEDLRFKHPNGHFGILSAGREDHSRFRRLLSHSFSERGMREQQPTINGYVDLLLKGLQEGAAEGSVDMVKWFNWTTFDIIGRLSFGEDFSCLRTATMHPWIEAVFGNVKALIMITTFRRYGLERILPYIASQKAIRMRQYNWDYCSEKVEARVKRGTDQGDFFNNVLKHNGQKTGMSTEEIKSNASNLVLAGSETTATLLSGTVYQLVRNPDALKKITTEIRNAFTSVDEIDLFSTTKLKFTLAVLDETMRIYPPVPTQNPRTVPAGGDTVLGKYIPGGTVIQLPQYVAHHLSSNFTRPEEFIPERFLGVPEFKNDNYAVMQPFSVGPRNCIGKNLAYAEMRLILAKFLFTFDIELDGKTQEPWTNQRTFVLWEKHPLWIKLRLAN